MDVEALLLLARGPLAHKGPIRSVSARPRSSKRVSRARSAQKETLKGIGGALGAVLPRGQSTSPISQVVNLQPGQPEGQDGGGPAEFRKAKVLYAFDPQYSIAGGGDEQGLFTPMNKGAAATSSPEKAESSVLSLFLRRHYALLDSIEQRRLHSTLAIGATSQPLLAEQSSVYSLSSLPLG